MALKNKINDSIGQHRTVQNKTTHNNTVHKSFRYACNGIKTGHDNIVYLKTIQDNAV